MGCGASSSRTSDPSNPVAGVAANNRGPERPSKRVTIPKKWKYGSKITVEDLAKMREEFWHTRVDGNQAMWLSLKGAADALIEGREDMANSLLQAAQITTPEGSLLSCYDELGHEYVVPKWGYSNPSDLIQNSAHKEAQNTCPSSLGGGDPVTVHFRVAPGEKDFTIETTTGTSIEHVKFQLKQKIEESSEEIKREIPYTAAQRIVFRGKELKNNETVGNTKIDSTFIVQAYFCRQQY